VEVGLVKSKTTQEPGRKSNAVKRLSVADP